MRENTPTRRDVIRHGWAIAASGLLLPGCTNRVRLTGREPVPSSEKPLSRDDVVLGLYSRESVADPAQAVRDVCTRLDWSWLARGDSVFVKLACNSSRPHPAATSSHAVRAVVTELRERGAGRVLVGDQSGVGYVRFAGPDLRFSSTREMARQNGLLDAITASGAEPHFFDEHDFEKDYFEVAAGPDNQHWRQPPRLAGIIRQVDHIIYLPRIASHVIAGYTHGHKIAVGWLRDDSRFQMHYEADTFHRKYAEISYVPDLRNRLRLVITLSERMILGVGPHQGTPGIFDSWIVLGSRNLANHDAVSVAMLAYVDRHSPPNLHIIPPSYGPFSDAANWTYITRMVPRQTGIPWGTPDPWHYRKMPIHSYQRGIAHDLALSRAYEITGGIPQHIPVVPTGQEPDARLRAFLRFHDGGRLAHQTV